MANVIRVSFKDKEKQLYEDIKKACDVIGDSAWMKIAAMDKLKKDNQNVAVNKSNDNKSFINSLDELMKQK